MNNNTEYHPNIEAYLLGQLSPEAQALFKAAMQQDPDLAEAVELRRLEFDVAEAIVADDIRAQMAALQAEDDKPEKASPGSAPQTFSRWWVALGLLCLAALFLWINRSSAPNAVPTSPSIPSNAPQPLNDSSPQQPNDSPPQRPPLQARNQAVRLYQRPDLGTFRGNDNPDDPLVEAIKAWEQHDYAKVSAYCEAIPADNPSYWRAQYIRAHAAFNRKRFGEAAALFSNISNSKVMPWAEESDWYGLLSLLAANKRGTPSFEQLWEKIKGDVGHPYRSSLTQINR